MVDVDIWAQRLTHHLQDHMETEREALHSYAHLAEATQSDRVRFLINMIIDDQVRHHRTFRDMIHWIRAEHSQRDDVEVQMGRGSLTAVGDEREHLVEMTHQLLAMLREEDRDLDELETMVKEVADTAWWSALIEVMRLDAKKHVLILETVEKLAMEGRD